MFNLFIFTLTPRPNSVAAATEKYFMDDCALSTSDVIIMNHCYKNFYVNQEIKHTKRIFWIFDI